MNIRKRLMLRYTKSFDTNSILYRKFNIKVTDLFTELSICINSKIERKPFVEFAKTMNKEKIVDMQKFIEKSKSNYYLRKHNVMKKRNKLKTGVI